MLSEEAMIWQRHAGPPWEDTCRKVGRSEKIIMEYILLCSDDIMKLSKR